MKTKGNAIVINSLFGELDSLGVTEFCVCAGARNAPIIEALTVRAASMQNSELKIYHFFDERSASFFALGRVMESRRSVAVLTTSGTAVAELLPAMVEAYYQNLPLVAVTADRPSRYRGSGAPQAIEQQGIFGNYVSRTVEIECAFDGRFQISDGGDFSNGPVHFNVCLEEGSEFKGRDASDAVAFGASLIADPALTDFDAMEWREFWAAEGKLLVLAGGIHPDDVPAAREFLLNLKMPVMAEATSNLCDNGLLQPLFIRDGEKSLVTFNAKRVLRIGAVPSWRWWRDLDERDDVRVLNVTRAQFRGLARTVNVVTLPWAASGISDFGFQISDWEGGDGLLDRALDPNPKSEPAWMRHLSRVIPAGATVFLGNSLPIREWNLAADAPKPGTVFYANRGANGIDGLVSSWLGVSAESDESWLIVGDLSALYDLGAPWILPQLKKARRRIVVINNGGGKIFSQVSWLQQLPADAKRVMENPHSISFEPWAQMWGMDYRLITDPSELRDDDSPCAVWEIRPDAAQTEAFWAAWK